MLRQLAKIARTPPSPKKSAWMMSATLTAMTAAHGPSTIAISVPPTPWAVVPPGTGMLNIMIVKLIAAKTARSGIVRLDRTAWTRRVARPQVGSVAAPIPTEMIGLRYPSGMCTLPPRSQTALVPMAG